MSSVATIIISIGVALAFFYFGQVSIRVIKEARSGKDDDSWRDPPPMIYKMFKPLIKIIAPDIKSIIKENQYEVTERKLSSAGMNYAILPEEFVSLRFICLLVGCGITSYIYVTYAPLDAEILFVVMMIIPISYFYPDLWVRDQIKARKVRITKDFPFLLDLLVLSMRAGLNYSSALGQSIESLGNGPVKEDFSRMLREIRAGRPRSVALSDLAERMDVPSINNFVAAMNQAEETGGEMVDILNTQSEQRRIERFLQAEEQASKAPVKMLIPMMLFLFPVIFMLIGFVILVGLGEDGVLPDNIWAMLN